MKRITTGAVLAAAVAAVVPMTASAATTQTAQSNLSLTGGSLAISVPGASTLTSTALNVGTVNGGINPAQWSDLTGSGAGWHGTIAVQQFHVTGTGAWAPGASHALTNNDTAAYTGAAANAFYKIAVTADTGTNISFTFSGAEAGTVNAALKSSGPVAFGVNGMTIQFVPATTYTAADVYTARVGNFATTALSLRTASGSIAANGTTTGGANLATLTNNAATVTSGSPSTYSAAPVTFASAAAGAGAGTFDVTPGVTVAWDPNNTWAATYTASAQYTIVTGP